MARRRIDLDQLMNEAEKGAETTREKVAPPRAAHEAKIDSDLQKRIEDLTEALKKADECNVVTGPVTGLKIQLRFEEIDPDLVIPSPENDRDQAFINETSLSDILPEIKETGQNEPILVRPTADGRYEAADGTRRTACCRIAGIPVKARVGDIPDADMKAFSLSGNKSKPLSYYEKSQAFEKLIENGTFSSWNQLAAAYELSKSKQARYKALVELNRVFVEVLEFPSDMPLAYGEDIKKLLTNNKKQVMGKVEELLKNKDALIKNPDIDYKPAFILKELKSSLKSGDKKLKHGESVVYKSTNGQAQFKHAVSKTGANKFEVKEASDEQIEKVKEFLINLFKAEKKES